MKHLIFTVLTISTLCLHLQLSAQESTTSQIMKDPGILSYQPVQLKAGFNLGMESPYSGGIELSLLFNELIDANIGCGLGLNGAKVGLGARIFPVRQRKVSPMLGIYYYHTTGLDAINVAVNMDQAEYKMMPGNAVLFNSGARFRFSKGHYLIAGIGYSVALQNERVRYVSGSESLSIRSYADMIGLGGFSINFGILLKLNGGHFLKRT